MSAFSARLNAALSRPRIERELNERYALAVAAWEDAHGCLVDDFTGEQFGRFSLWHALKGDAAWAARIWFQRLLVDGGLISDGDMAPTPGATHAREGMA